MSNPTDTNTNNNERHDGFVWSQYVHVAYALVLAAVIAFTLAAPALAEGAVGFGKKVSFFQSPNRRKGR